MNHLYHQQAHIWQPTEHQNWENFQNSARGPGSLSSFRDLLWPYGIIFVHQNLKQVHFVLFKRKKEAIIRQQVRNKHVIGKINNRRDAGTIFFIFNKTKKKLPRSLHPEVFYGVKYFRIQLYLALTLETPSIDFTHLLTGNRCDVRHSC